MQKWLPTWNVWIAWNVQVREVALFQSDKNSRLILIIFCRFSDVVRAGRESPVTSAPRSPAAITEPADSIGPWDITSLSHVNAILGGVECSAQSVWIRGYSSTPSPFVPHFRDYFAWTLVSIHGLFPPPCRCSVLHKSPRHLSKWRHLSQYSNRDHARVYLSMSTWLWGISLWDRKSGLSRSSMQWAWNLSGKLLLTPYMSNIRS